MKGDAKVEAKSAEKAAQGRGEIVHVEFPSADFEKSSAFYGTLFGWRTEAEQSGGHLGVHVPGQVSGSGGVQASWIRSALAYASAPVVFVGVADVSATLEDVKRLGGRVLVARQNLPGRGPFALLADPDGNVVAVTALASPHRSDELATDARTSSSSPSPTPDAPSEGKGSRMPNAAKPSAPPAPTPTPAPAPVKLKPRSSRAKR